MLHLQPYVASQAKIFPEADLDGLLEASEVKSDQQRMTESSGMRTSLTDKSCVIKVKSINNNNTILSIYGKVLILIVFDVPHFTAQLSVLIHLR